MAPAHRSSIPARPAGGKGADGPVVKSNLVGGEVHDNPARRSGDRVALDSNERRRKVEDGLRITRVEGGIGRPPFNEPPPDCIGCLACAEICPTDHIKFTTSNSYRTIWGKEFEMLRDPSTGEAVITKAQAEHFAERSGVPMSYFETSDTTKRLEMAKTFAKLSDGK